MTAERPPSLNRSKGTQMLKRLLSAAMVAVAGTALAACGGADGGGARHAAPANGDAAATVTIVDMSFAPAATTVRVGEAVAWAWDDGRVEHDVVFDGGPASPRQRKGTWQRTFDGPGTYEYVCSLHPNMTGRVIVG